MRKAILNEAERRRSMQILVRLATLGIAMVWILSVVVIGWWLSNRLVEDQLKSLEASAEYEAKTTARIMDRLFAEMVSVANMVARQGSVVQLASKYRIDPPGFENISRQHRAAHFTNDPLVRKVGEFMNELSGDLRYARIYMNNMSDDTVTASNWADLDSIVGMIYSGRPYLADALRYGSGHSFGIARLNKTPSYFVASRIESEDDTPLGSVTVKFDAPEIALYLSGMHTALIVDRKGRVTTASDPSFMLRNAMALLPAGSTVAVGTSSSSIDEEDLGMPLDVRDLSKKDHADQRIVEGRQYLIRRVPLEKTQYQLVTLASLDSMPAMREQHYWILALLALVGLLFILLFSHIIGLMVVRRHDEWYAANHDALTNLPNRRYVLAQLDRLYALTKRTQQWVFVAFIDLDGFKKINDNYGHEVGDQFLVEISKRLSEGLRESDVLARLGGDEFLVVGVLSPPQLMEQEIVVDAMRRRLAQRLIGIYEFGACSFNYAGASLGVVSVDPFVCSPQSALKEADKRMYADKQIRRSLRKGLNRADSQIESCELFKN